MIVIRKSKPSSNPNKRKERIASQLTKIISEFILRLGMADVFISITHLDITKDLRNCKIYISIFPTKNESYAYAKLNNEMKNLVEYIKKNTRLQYLPRFVLKIDEGEKNRQRVEEILKND